ncbi:type IV pilus biogenesis/stability protein PilW [Candidatus Methylospira mobilis]|uniref:type IV pilus biogenesis/stability protein PilW n=1 Tax=Candidatus Methylospira mobilis TaxID=1808979 RepID=UPI0028F00CF3|nr:type IV pilus biogenesis/stability protein PilW [Candidatus Methylospira mobilis]WNV06479.1 type IV pilus biogenesis/stability protein PilW [Candidatus Methylospira mobilis]
MIKAAVICECIRRLHDAHAYWVLGLAVVLHGCVSQDVAENQGNRAAEASRIYVQKGVRYMENGQLDIALQDMTHALALDDANISAHNALAVLYERTGRLPEAEQQYRQALVLDASDPATLNNYGRFLCEQGAYARAQEYFDQAGRNRLYATPWLVLTNAGVCSHRSGKLGQAEEALREALQLNAGFTPALLEMASVKLDGAQFADARSYFRRYESANGHLSADALWIAIRIAAGLQDQASLDACLGELRGRFPDSVEARTAERRFP